MRILMTGHAGMFVEANGRTILCDPWFNGAYFGSWFPFPDNAGIDTARIGAPDYLYVSHLHKDHFDARFLAEHVDKSATVLLPDFPLDDMRRALEGLGFSKFIETRSGQRVALEDGVHVAITTSTSVADGPIGDSTLVVDDGVTRILDQNDCHPRDLRALRALGPYDVHFLQYSGAIWYPMVYRFDEVRKAEIAQEKRVRQGQRAMQYIQSLRAAHVVPFAGPPAFLDDDLFELNDFDDDPANIFQDQPSFLRALEAHGIGRGHLAVSGSEIVVGPGVFEVSHHTPTGDVASIYAGKREYLRRFQARRRAEIAAAVPTARARCGADPGEVVAAMAAWIGPLLSRAPSVCRALGGSIHLDVGRFGVVIDPGAPEVRLADLDGADAATADHSFSFTEALLESLVDRTVEDWVNELFLSCRFDAARKGEYNETVFSFFKCLSARRMDYLEASLVLASRSHEDGVPPGELWRCGDYLVQRRCPHLGADLSRFGRVEDGVLTCSLHGNRYDIESGRCLTAEGFGLFTVRADDATEAPAGGVLDGPRSADSR